MNAIGKSSPSENGRITSNDRVIILDAGAQYAKVNCMTGTWSSTLIHYYFRSSTERFVSFKLSQRFCPWRRHINTSKIKASRPL